MGKLNIITNGTPLAIDVWLQTNKFIDVQLYVKHSEFYQTVLTLRNHRFKGLKKFRLMLPYSPREVQLVAREQSSLDEKKVKIQKHEFVYLDTNISKLPNNKDLRDFIPFALDFCMRATYAPKGLYISKGGIRIKYVDVLKSIVDGVEMKQTSPARVDSHTKEIEVAKDYFKFYTVYGRFALLLHEFAHVYLNKVMKSEEEADRWCADIYLGLGFPRVELLNTWIRVYRNADNQSNRERLNKFIAYVNAA